MSTKTHFRELPPSRHWAYLAATGLASSIVIIQLYLYATSGTMWSLLVGVVVGIATIAGHSKAHRPMLYALGIPFLVGQVFAWAMQGMPYAQLGLITGSLQGLLIAMLIYLLWVDQARRNMAIQASTVPQ